MEIPPCVLQDIGPLGPLPKKEGGREKKIIRKPRKKERKKERKCTITVNLCKYGRKDNHRNILLRDTPAALPEGIGIVIEFPMALVF